MDIGITKCIYTTHGVEYVDCYDEHGKNIEATYVAQAQEQADSL